MTVTVSQAQPLTGTLMTVTLATQGLVIGSFAGHITVSAPNAAGSPQAINVRLDILPADGQYRVYLPIVTK